MSGANQIQKFAQTNREDQLAPLSAIGTEFHQRSLTLVTATNAPVFAPFGGFMPASLFATDFIIDAATPNPLSGPTAIEMCQYFQTLTTAQEGQRGLNPSAIGSRFEIVIENSDIVARQITLLAGFTPGLITLAASTTYLASFELTALAPIQTWELFMLIPTTGPGGGPSGVTDFMQSANAQAAPFLNLAPARFGNVVAAVNDYVAADIGVAASVLSGIPTGNLQTTLDAKVTLRNNAGAIGTGALALGDILVATAAGDQYVPSAFNHIGRMGAINFGIDTNTLATTTGFVVENVAGGAAAPTNGVVDVTLADDIPAASGGYAALRVDTQLALAFGQGGNTQSAFRIIMPPALPAATGANGSYAIEVDIAGVKQFFVNNAGMVRVTDSTAVGTQGPVLMDAANMLTLNASLRKLKDEIKDIGDTSFILKVHPRQYVWKSDTDRHVQVGAIVEEVIDAGASPSYLHHNLKENKDGTKSVDHSAPRDLNDRALFWALVDQVQKLHRKVDQLEKREKPKSAKKETPSM